MKKLMMLVVCVLLVAGFAGCKFSEKTGLFDGNVSIVESIMIKAGVKVALGKIPVTAQAGLHIVAAGLLDKLDNDAVTLSTIETELPQVVADAGITDRVVLAAIDEIAAGMKAEIVSRIEEGDNKVYLVGVKAILEEIYAQTEVI